MPIRAAKVVKIPQITMPSKLLFRFEGIKEVYFSYLLRIFNNKRTLNGNFYGAKC